MWLVKTVGLVLAVIGAVLIYAQMTGGVPTPVILLAIASSLELTIVEVVYVIQRVISPIYLEDAAVELILMAWWTVDVLIA